MLHDTHPRTAVLKLSSGEEIICTIKSKSGAGYTVSKPLMIIQSPQGWQFSQILLMADPEADVMLYGIVAEAPAHAKMEANYLSATSGIALPTPSGIIGG